MAIGKDTRFKDRKAPRQEFEVAYYTKELGRPLQRKMLEKQLAGFTDDSKAAAGHGEDVTSQLDASPPPEDRAG